MCVGVRIELNQIRFLVIYLFSIKDGTFGRKQTYGQLKCTANFSVTRERSNKKKQTIQWNHSTSYTYDGDGIYVGGEGNGRKKKELIQNQYRK